MTINTSLYHFVEDIQHKINLDAISCAADMSGTRIMLPYRLSEELTEIPELRAVLMEIAIHGAYPAKAAYTGYNPCNYNNVIKKVDFLLSVNIQKRRQALNLYAKITPTEGRTRRYIILCDSEQAEVQAVAQRYIAAGNPIPYTWLGFVEAAQTV